MLVSNTNAMYSFTPTLAPDQMNKIQPQLKEEVMDKAGRIYTRRYVQIDKFCDSVVKNIKPPDGEFKNSN